MALDPSSATMLDIVNKLNDMTGVNNKLDLLNAYNAIGTSNATIKTNLVNAINSSLGQSATTSDSYSTLTSDISSVVNRGAVTITPGTTDQAITAGYHNGSGKVKGDANLVAGNIASGVAIFGVTGTMVNGAGMKRYATSSVSASTQQCTVSGLPFTPSVVYVKNSNPSTMYNFKGDIGYTNMGSTCTCTISGTSFTFGYTQSSTLTGTWTWWAYE